MTAYSNITYQSNTFSANDISSILSGAENPGYKYSSNSVVPLTKSPTVYLDRLQILSDDFIKNYIAQSSNNFSSSLYIDIIFDEPTLVHGSIIVGYNLITNHMDLSGLRYSNLSNINNLNLLNNSAYPEIKLQYSDHDMNELIDLHNGSIVSQEAYKNSIESALNDNRPLYKVPDSIRDHVDVAISNKTLNMPEMKNLGVYLDKEKNVITYLNPIGIFNQVIADPENGEINDSNYAVIDTNPTINDSNLYAQYNASSVSNNIISNTIVLIPEPILIKKLRLLVRSPSSFICNVSAFYIDDHIYAPTVYDTDAGHIDIAEQVNSGRDPISLSVDNKIMVSNDSMTMISAKLVWQGQKYTNIDDNLVYTLNKKNANIDLSQAYIKGKNFQASSTDSWFIDGEIVSFESLKDFYCDFGDDSQNIKVMYIHNIGIPSSLIANNAIPGISLNIDVYNINNIQSDLVKTIKFSKPITYLSNSYSQSINYPSVQSFDKLEEGLEKLLTSNTLAEYIYPESNNANITIDTGKEGSIDSNRILYSTQVVYFDPDMAKIFDIKLDIPKYTEQNTELILLSTQNFCQLGLDSNEIFDKDNFKILFTNQDSVNTFEDNTSFVLVFMAKGIGSFKDTIIIHRITTIISGN
jgi:hypothetical protein